MSTAAQRRRATKRTNRSLRNVPHTYSLEDGTPIPVLRKRRRRFTTGLGRSFHEKQR